MTALTLSTMDSLLVRTLRAALEEEMKVRTDFLARGGADTWELYQRKAGEIGGFREALAHLEEIREQILKD